MPVGDDVQRICEDQALRGINSRDWIPIQIDVVRHEEEARQQAEAIGEPGVGSDVGLARYVRSADSDLQAIVDRAIEVEPNILPAIISALENSFLLLCGTGQEESIFVITARE